jgi:hypothetical protein
MPTYWNDDWREFEALPWQPAAPRRGLLDDPPPEPSGGLLDNRHYASGSLFDDRQYRGDAKSLQPRQSPPIPLFTGWRGETVLPPPAIADHVTGRGRREPDIPELSQEWLRDGHWLLPFYLSLAETDEGKRRILQNLIPSMPNGSDRFENPLAYRDGQKTYVNKPGLSLQDGYDAATNLRLTGGGGAAGAAIGMIMGGPLGAGVGTVVGLGGGSLTKHGLGRLAGSEEGLNWKKLGWELFKKVATRGLR